MARFWTWISDPEPQLLDQYINDHAIVASVGLLHNVEDTSLPKVYAELHVKMSLLWYHKYNEAQV